MNRVRGGLRRPMCILSLHTHTHTHTHTQTRGIKCDELTVSQSRPDLDEQTDARTRGRKEEGLWRQGSCCSHYEGCGSAAFRYLGVRSGKNPAHLLHNPQ